MMEQYYGPGGDGDMSLRVHGWCGSFDETAVVLPGRDVLVQWCEDNGVDHKQFKGTGRRTNLFGDARGSQKKKDLNPNDPDHYDAFFERMKEKEGVGVLDCMEWAVTNQAMPDELVDWDDCPGMKAYSFLMMARDSKRSDKILSAYLKSELSKIEAAQRDSRLDDGQDLGCLEMLLTNIELDERSV